MADNQVVSVIGYVDKRRNNKGVDPGNANGNHVAAGVSDATNYASVAGLRARLTAVNAGYYTAARLNTLTLNDMVMAVRLADDAGGL